MSNPAAYAETNIAGTLNLLNACANHGVRKFVFSSSAAVYGNPDYLPLDEEHPLRPTNFYGYTKLAVEELLAWYDQLKDIRFVALRYFNAVGYDPMGRIREREIGPSNLLPIVLEVVAGERERIEVFGGDYDTPDGTCLRDYIHVSDLAQGHALALDYLAAGNPSEYFNLGTNEAVSVLDVIKAAESISGHPVPYRMVARRLGDPGAVRAEFSRARKVLGWLPTYSNLKTVIETMLPMYRQFRN